MKLNDLTKSATVVLKDIKYLSMILRLRRCTFSFKLGGNLDCETAEEICKRNSWAMESNGRDIA